MLRALILALLVALAAPAAASVARPSALLTLESTRPLEVRGQPAATTAAKRS